MDVFECFNCSKKLRTREGIIKHLKKCMERTRKGSTDSLKTRLSCEHCPKQFSTCSGLIKHRKKNHGLRIQKEKSIKCNYCSATFASVQGRLVHSKKHPEYKLKRNQLISRRLHDCIFCGKTFTRKSYRTQHEEICMKKRSPIGSSSMSDVNVTEFHLQENLPDEQPQNSCANTNTLPFQFQNTSNSLETPRFDSYVDESLNNTSCGSVNVTPRLQRYLRDRKNFLKLGSPDMSTPRRRRINLQYGQETVREYQKQVATLQQKVRRLQQQVKTFKDLLHHLEEQNQISATEADAFLNELPSAFQALALRKKMGRKTSYDSDVKKFALTLEYYSRRAYEYVREAWGDLLPATSTLRNWYSQLKGEPGFCEEALEALKAHVKAAEANNQKVICSFVFDEMEIRKELIFDGKKYHGYVDMGFGAPSDSDSQPLAKKAMVFMLVCLNGRWKLPFAYFLVDSLNGKGLSKLITTGLQLIDDCGVIVRSLTFDGLGINRTCVKILGAQLNFGPEFRPWFSHPSHPEERVFVFLDPCHALKLTRNTVGDYTLTDGNERPISFFDFTNLYNLQVEKELYSAIKLTKRHINWRENKMKVRLATQLFSSSVSSALLHAKKKGFPQFQNCEGTAQFCEKFDGIFDMLNSRSCIERRLKPRNAPIRLSNKSHFVQWCQEAEQYITTLKINGTSILHHDRSCGFVGIIMCLRNIVPLYECLNSYGLSYLLTYKISQDHLENWFSAVRSKGGFNNNPNVLQFKSTFKRLLVHHELRTSDNANCANDSDIKILSIKSISSGSTVYAQHNEEWLYSLTAEDIIGAEELNPALDEYQEDVVAHIAGFILRKLEDKKLASRKEVEKLKNSSNKSAYSDLILLKSRGRLILPGDMIIQVCLEVEKKVRIYEEQLLNPNKTTAIIQLIFGDLEEAGFFDLFDDQLAQLVVTIYVKLRLKYICKRISEIDKNIRHRNTKLVLFNNQ